MWTMNCKVTFALKKDQREQNKALKVYSFAPMSAFMQVTLLYQTTITFEQCVHLGAEICHEPEE